MDHADVLLVDGTNLAHRVWHSAGCDPYRASVSYTAMVRNALALCEPRFAAVAFDAPTCWRKRVYPAYKAQRPPREERFTDWMEGLRGLERIAGARVVVAPDHEADDVLATLTWDAINPYQYGDPDFTVMLVTGDQDAWCLIGPRVAVALMSTGVGARYVNESEVERILGVPPSLVLPYKALVGDPSDNVKGVPGIGPVRARKALELCRGLKGRDAIELAVESLEARHLRCSRAEARELAIGAWRIVRPQHKAPVGRRIFEFGIVK